MKSQIKDSSHGSGKTWRTQKSQENFEFLKRNNFNLKSGNCLLSIIYILKCWQLQFVSLFIFVVVVYGFAMTFNFNFASYDFKKKIICIYRKLSA